jgi:hypothetical protein
LFFGNSEEKKKNYYYYSTSEERGKKRERERERFSFFSLGAVTEKFITDHEPMLQISGWEMSSTHLNLSSRGPLALL